MTYGDKPLALEAGAEIPMSGFQAAATGVPAGGGKTLTFRGD